MRAFVLLGLFVATPGLSQSCPSPAGWNQPVRHVAARTPAMKFALATGTTSEIALVRARDVRLAVPSPRATKPGTTAGLAALDAPRAGTLDVILSKAVYVDLIRDGKVLKSTGHSDLKTCPGVRKSVSFAVTPGRYVVQLTDGQDKAVKLATSLR